MKACTVVGRGEEGPLLPRISVAAEKERESNSRIINGAGTKNAGLGHFLHSRICQSKKGFFDSTFFDWVLRLGHPVEKLRKTLLFRLDL